MRIVLPEAERHTWLHLMGGEMLALCGRADLLTGRLRAGTGRPAPCAVLGPDHPGRPPADRNDPAHGANVSPDS